MSLIRSALRLAADGPTRATPHDLPQLARFLQRTLLARNATHTPAVRALSRAYKSAVCEYRRSYATSTDATKPTATVKKAVKAKAAKKAAPKKPSTRTKAAAKPKKKTVAKKAAPKKKKKVAKRELTPEEKAKQQIATLKKRALSPPPTRVTAFNLFLADQAKNQKYETPEERHQMFGQASASFKNLAPAEREHYNHMAEEQAKARAAEFKAWVHSHTPEQIYDANLARLHLRRIIRESTGKVPPNTRKIIDDRHVPRPATAFARFFGERKSSGDMKGISTRESGKLISEEWKAMSESEKKFYVDEATSELEQYKKNNRKSP